MGAVETRYDAAIARLERAAQPDRAVPDGFRPYLDQVRRGAYRITDEDVAALLRAGHSEDEVFELTVAAAVAAGLERRDAALAVLR